MQGVISNSEAAAAWSLRSAWALRRAVVVTLDMDDPRRLDGWVAHVDASDAAADIETLNGRVVRVPCVVILSVRAPHFHEPADRALLEAPKRERRLTVLDRFPGQLMLPLEA